MRTQVGPSEPVEIESLKEREKWIAFAEKLLALCLEIQSAADVQITEKLFAEPKILALALLCRSFRNLKGVIALASEGLVVEARTLARSCYENSFLVAGLIEKGESFVEEMYDDDVKSMRSPVSDRSKAPASATRRTIATGLTIDPDTSSAGRTRRR